MERRTPKWADRHGLFPDAAHRERVERTRYGWLAARYRTVHLSTNADSRGVLRPRG
ncbi:hypothetical protein [Streptomyces radicis]|uniref:hypothetical protein n=1 Tax=Streptomyces radicis TaxID=1750517 RepID=UPI001602EF3F|nr:hypothetical protein [Streptomyces radicis]